MKIKLTLILTLIVVSTYSLAEEVVVDLFSLTLEELLQVKITGSTRSDENIQTVPSAVTIFTQNEIDKMGLDYLDELANLVPGFQSYRMAGTSLQYPMSARGRRIGVVAAEILVMIDGQRVDSPRSSGMGIVFPRFSLKLIERVEFIRGPGAALYGSNAMMGVINIVTRSNEDKVSVAFGNMNRRNLSMQTYLESDSFSLDLFLQLDSDNGDEYFIPDTFSTTKIKTKDPKQINDLRVKFKWKDTQINLIHSKFNTHDFYELDQISNGTNERNGRFTSLHLKQSFNWKKVNSWLSFSIKESSVNLSTQLTPAGGLAEISEPSSSEPLFVKAHFGDFQEARIQWHNAKKVSDNTQFQFGTEIRYIEAPEIITRNNFDLGDLANGSFPIRYYGNLLPTTSVQKQSTRNIYGLYAQVQHELFNFAQLTVGLRYDDFNGIGSQLSPRLGLVKQLNEQQSIKILYGQAFRAPSEQELNNQNNPILDGNPNLKPETVKSFDLIWIGKWSDFFITLGYFENHFNEAIVETPTKSGVSQYNNIDQAPTKGVELEFSYQINDHWLIKSSYSHLNEIADQSYRQATDLMSLTAYYNNNNWQLSVISTWNNERELSAEDIHGNRIIIDNTLLINSKISYRFNEKFKMFIQTKNLLNNSYYSPSLGSGLLEGVPNRGREILVGVNWSF